MRYGTTPITDSNFAAQSTVAVSGTFTTGQALTANVSGLTVGSLYYFRIKAIDARGNTSSMDTGSVAFISVSGDTKRPATIADLVALKSNTEGAIVLTWTVPYEDYDTPSSGTPDKYELRVGTFAFTDVEFSSQTKYTISNGSVAVGQTFTYTLQSLTAGVTYYFRIKSLDEVPNTSLIDTMSPQASARAGFVQAGIIAGKVTMAIDHGINGVEVRAEPEGVAVAAVTVFTQRDGSYRLENLDVTVTYKVTVSWTVNQIKSAAYRTKISPKDSAPLNFKLEIVYQLTTITGAISLSPAVKEAFRQAALRAAPGAPIIGPAFIELIQDGRIIIGVYGY